MGTHPIFESDFDCLTECQLSRRKPSRRALAMMPSKRSRDLANERATKWTNKEPMKRNGHTLRLSRPKKMASGKKKAPDVRTVQVPPNRLSPLKESWKKLYEPI